MVFDVAGPIGADVHNQRRTNGIYVIQGRALIDPVKVIASGSVVEVIALILLPVVMPSVKREAVAIAYIDIEPAQLIVIVITVDRDDSVVLVSIGERSVVGLRKVLEVIHRHRVDTVGGNDIAWEGRARDQR